MLKLYNGLTKKKEPFEPHQSDKVNLYVCGITVYDRCHLGHARSMIGFDMIVRFLRASGYEVNFVRNITDIDDKIIERAITLGVSIQSLTTDYIKAMYEDTTALGLLSPDNEPKATDFINPIIQLIQRLISQDMAYASEDGDVYFEVAKFKNYGQLSGQELSGLMSGARIEVVTTKRSPLDFVLWKKAKPGEPFWPSPWGEGRPGWHIECSAMSLAAFGDKLDIHGGGVDLQFPHHENEIAQSEGATGHHFAKYWMHVGLLQINSEKMAKSTGNFLTIDSVLKNYPAEVLRYFYLSSHYRSALNFSDEALSQSYKSLMRLYQTLKGFDLVEANTQQTWVDKFFTVMNDDFNTPEALSVLFDLSHEVNKSKDRKLVATLKYLGGVLGLLQADPHVFLQSGIDEATRTEIETLILERRSARERKDFQRADEIRALLIEKGIEIEDGSQETTWRFIGG